MLDEKDHDTIEALRTVGVKRNVAAIIVYLKDQEEVTSRDVEKRSGLRQPEVSIAMRVLHERGWIAEREIKKEGRGRPMKLYKLTVFIEDIIGYYEEEKRIESSQAMQFIQKLKEITAT